MLEQVAIGYVFPDEIQKSMAECQQQQNNTQTSDCSNAKSKSPEQDWQFVIPVPASGEKSADDIFMELDESKYGFGPVGGNTDGSNGNGSGSTESTQTSGIIPAARARLASLRDLGAKKIGALKLKLIENKIKSNERGKRQSYCDRTFFLKLYFIAFFWNINLSDISFRSKSPKYHTIGNHAHAKFCAGNFNHKNWSIFHCTIVT